LKGKKAYLVEQERIGGVGYERKDEVAAGVEVDGAGKWAVKVGAEVVVSARSGIRQRTVITNRAHDNELERSRHDHKA